ncbi:hypothetical protein SBA4_4830014 [Candidatus Sulfopaludibacter sp. SbA4]|nr:hypothetical protein SBA4_4830014 [Candidatus Sulfopaludibacter sp. SbA4]
MSTPPTDDDDRIISQFEHVLSSVVLGATAKFLEVNRRNEMYAFELCFHGRTVRAEFSYDRIDDSISDPGPLKQAIGEALRPATGGK